MKFRFNAYNKYSFCLNLYLNLNKVKKSICFLVFLMLFSCNEGEKTNSLESKCSVFSVKFIEKEGSIALFLNFSDSVKGKFLFDTGCQFLIMDSLFKHNKIDNTENFSMLNKFEKPEYFKIASMPYKFDMKNVDLRNLSEYIDNSTNGILGISYFFDYPFGLNFDDSIFRLTSCGALSKDYKEYNVNQIDTKGDQIIINATVFVNGIKISGPFLFDTGSEIDIVLSRETMTKYNLDTILDKVNYKASRFHLYGNSNGFFLRGSKLNVFKQEILNPLIYCCSDSTDPISDYSIEKCLGLVGIDVINKFNFIIDAKNGKIFTKRNARTFERTKFEGSGIICVDRRKTIKGLEISGLFIGSDANLKGIHLGDIILSINGKNVNKMEIVEIRNLLMNNNSKITIAYKRGHNIFTKELVSKVIIN